MYRANRRFRSCLMLETAGVGRIDVSGDWRFENRRPLLVLCACRGSSQTDAFYPALLLEHSLHRFRPINQPTNRPTDRSTDQLTKQPSNRPSNKPTNQPTNQPTDRPTDQPSNQLTDRPTNRPSNSATEQPSNHPNQVTERATDQPIIE